MGEVAESGSAAITAVERRVRRRQALGAVPAAAFRLDQLMLGHRDFHQRQVEDLALHPGHRPPRQARPAPSQAARLMPHLPVRPGRLRQRGALMPVLAPRPAPASFPPPRPRRRLVQPLTGRRLRGIAASASAAPQAQRSAPAPAPAPQPPGPARPGTPPAPRAASHQRGQHLIRGTGVITRHTRTLLPSKIAYTAIPASTSYQPSIREITKRSKLT